MKYIMCSRVFPAGHPRKGEPTYFVEKIWKGIWDEYSGMANPLYPFWENYDQAFPCTGNAKENIHQHQPKHHTIRAGSRCKPGETVSLRVWSGRPYCSKQIEFAQVEVKKTLAFAIIENHLFLNGWLVGPFHKDLQMLQRIAANDGLEAQDFVDWFGVHPKKKAKTFTGQIICWNDAIEYSKPSLVTEKVTNE